MGNIGSEDFGELGGKTASGSVATVEDAFGAEFAHGHFDKSGGGVGASDADADIFVSADGGDAEFPVAAGVATDERHLGETSSEYGDVFGGGFAGFIACGFIPGVLKDDGLEFGSTFDDGVDGGVSTALGDPQFHTEHGAVGDAAFEFVEAGLYMFGVEIHKAEEAVGEGFDRFEHGVVLSAQIFGAGIGYEFQPHVNAVAFDAVTITDFDHSVCVFGGGFALARAGEVAVEIPDHVMLY